MMTYDKFKYHHYYSHYYHLPPLLGVEDSDDNNEDYSDDDDEEDDDIPEGEGRQYDAYNSTDGLPAGKYFHIYMSFFVHRYVSLMN